MRYVIQKLGRDVKSIPSVQTISLRIINGKQGSGIAYFSVKHDTSFVPLVAV